MKNNIFQKARIKLTLYYIIIMAFILLAFSSALVFTVESKIREGFRDRVVITEDDSDPISKASNEIEYFIYIIDGILLVLIGFSSYFLAGRTLRPIKESLESQKKFLADASHYLRTPIAIMTTGIEVTLQNGNSSKEDFKRLSISNLEESRNMNKIVNDLLLLARTETHIPEISRTHITEVSNVYITNLLNTIIDKMQSQADFKKLKVIKNIQEDLFININKENFEIAVKNILQNAINYTKAGTITVKLKKQNDKTILEVIDTGVGISKNDLPHIFDRFYKAEHSKNDATGSGLGLSIVKEIVEKSEGKIKIESEPNKGTVVTMVFSQK